MTVAELKAKMLDHNPHRERWNERWSDLWEQLRSYPDTMAVTRTSKVFHGSQPMFVTECANRKREWLRIEGPDVYVYSA